MYLLHSKNSSIHCSKVKNTFKHLIEFYTVRYSCSLWPWSWDHLEKNLLFIFYLFLKCGDTYELNLAFFHSVLHPFSHPGNIVVH